MDETLPNRKTNFSKMRLWPDSADNHVNFACETIRMGQAVTLVCESYGGNPLAAIVWYKNNQRIDDSYTTSGSISKNTIMFLAQPEDNNAVYRCEARNKMISKPLTAQIVMSVLCKWPF